MLNWFGIVRLGLVQMSLGAIVVLTTSTLNRLMVVELALPAVLPGALVALHYGIQITRPNWGYRSDQGGARTRWIVGGMGLLALGALGAALSIVVLGHNWVAGVALSVLAYALIGVGVGASGTSLLALLASATHPRRRAAAATITWLMMIFGIAATAGGIGQFLDPYSAQRLMTVVAAVCATAFVVTFLATWRVEAGCAPQDTVSMDAMPFREGLAEVWAEPAARVFTLFIALSMTAYFMQELILEPYAGLVFGLTPGATTTLSGLQNGGVFFGMLLVGIAATGLKIGSLRSWVMAGCVGSAAALVALAGLGELGQGFLTPVVVTLGFFNGMFAVAAIGSMMAMAGQGRTGRTGTRMGLWGASQALAAGFGGLIGAAAVDVLRLFTGTEAAFGTVFLAEAGLFVAAAFMAMKIMRQGDPAPSEVQLVPGE